MGTTPKIVFIIIAGVLYLFSCMGSKKVQKMERNDPVFTVPKTAEPVKNAEPPGFLETLMNSHPVFFDQVLKNRNEWNVQIMYTRVDRDEKGSPVLEPFNFHVDPTRYFYPASTVKLPVVLLALQRLNELKEKGIDRYTTMITEAAFGGQSVVYNDPTTPDGKPSIAHYIKKILMVSDNDAFNRLYEFLGQEYINDELHKKGYTGAQILHRLSIALSEEENRQANPVTFMDQQHSILYQQAAKRSKMQYSARNDFMGKVVNGGRITACNHATTSATNPGKWRRRACHYELRCQGRTCSRSPQTLARRPSPGSPAASCRADCRGRSSRLARRRGWAWACPSTCGSAADKRSRRGCS